MATLRRLSLVCAFVLGCGCSSTKKAEEAPQPAGEDAATTEAPPSGDGTTSSADDPPPPPSGTVKRTDGNGAPDNSVPDDYSLVEGDCIQLGKKLGSLWRSELRSTLSAKLNEKQREKAEQSIDDGATKKEDDWANGCIKSLVGKSVDPKSLKCAFDSKDLKSFEKCLN